MGAIFDSTQLSSDGWSQILQNCIKSYPILLTCNAMNIKWIHILGFRVRMVKNVLEYKQCCPLVWQAKCNLADFFCRFSSIVHLTGGGIFTDTFSMYALILSKCFSQKCCIVSRIGYGSKTLTRCEAILWLAFNNVTLVLFVLLDVTVVGPVTLTCPNEAKK